jgi:hypothetical protein
MGHAILMIETLGLDPPQDLDGVPSPVGGLCRWDTRVQVETAACLRV